MFEFKLSYAIIRPFYTFMLAIGAMIGVAALIIILSLFNNYYIASENIFMGIHPHVKISKEAMTEKEARRVIADLKNKFPQIDMAEPAIYAEVDTVLMKVIAEKAICVKEGDDFVCLDPMKEYPPDVETVIRYGYRITDKKEKPMLIKGVTIKNNDTPSGLKKIITGIVRLDDLNADTDQNNNPIPWSFYLQQDVFFGSVVLEDFLIRFPGIAPDHTIHLIQKGSLSMGTQRGELPLVVMSLQNVQQCLNRQDTVNTIEIRLKDPYASERLAVEMLAAAGSGFQIKTWVQHSRAAFAFLKVIRIMIFLIIFTTSIVAAIGVISTLTLIVLQNRGKIAILKALGIKAVSIYRIFIFNTLTIGVIGTILGTALGCGASYLLIRFFGDNLKKLGISNPGIQISSVDIFVIALSVILLFVVTAFIPSRRALEVDAVEGLSEQH